MIKRSHIIVKNVKKTYSQKSHFNEHISRRFHENIKKFACDNCDKKFTEKKSLLLHKTTIHEGIKPYKCDYCEKSFGSSFNLDRHDRNTHSKSQNCLMMNSTRDQKLKILL